MEIGSLADWVSGIGSLAAAVVALYVALDSQKIRLRGFCGHRVIVGIGQPPIDVLAISMTNISQRPTVVTNIGFTFGVLRWKKFGIITFMQDVISHGTPKPLSDGETGNWNVDLGKDEQWLKDLAEKFSVTRFAAATWKITIHTSNGGTTTLRPEKNLRKALQKHINSRKNVSI